MSANLKEYEPIKIKINSQGSVGVNDEEGLIYRKSDDIICAYIDLEIRGAVIEAYSGGDDTGPGVMLGVQAGDNLTHLTFPEFVGWTVFSADINKYTLAVCLTRRM